MKNKQQSLFVNPKATKMVQLVDILFPEKYKFELPQNIHVRTTTNNTHILLVIRGTKGSKTR